MLLVALEKYLRSQKLGSFPRKKNKVNDRIGFPCAGAAYEDFNDFLLVQSVNGLLCPECESRSDFFSGKL